jgi:hypothetical protein
MGCEVYGKTPVFIVIRHLQCAKKLYEALCFAVIGIHVAMSWFDIQTRTNVEHELVQTTESP